MSSAVRNIVMRALFEPDFHSLFLNNPDEALKEYSLAQPEIDALKNPGPDLYRFLQPGADIPLGGPVFGGNDPPPPPTTVVVVIIVAIIVFVAATKTGGSDSPVVNSDSVTERFNPLIKAIQQSTGVERMDLVKTLVNELTKEQ